jgi:hypothetical protein
MITKPTLGPGFGGSFLIGWRKAIETDGATRMSELIYGSYDGNPTVYEKDSGGVAWWYRDGAWVETHGPDVFVNMAVMDKADFDKRFPDLPAPPITGR